MTQEKDQKAGRDIGAGKKAAKTAGSIAPRPLSNRPSADPSVGQRVMGSSTRRDGRKSAPPREKLPSIEEISSSLLLSDDSASAKLPDLEELSGSLLLDDSTVVQAVPLPAAPAPAAATAAPPVASPSRPAPAAHRALLGLPDVLPSNPAPRLDARLAATTAAREPRGTPAPVPAPDLSALGFTASPAEAVGNAHEAHADLQGGAPPPAEGFAASEATAQVAPQTTAPVYGDVEVTSLPLGRIGTMTEVVKRGLGTLGSILVARPDPRRPRLTWFLAVVAMAGLTVGVGLVVLAVSLTREGPSANDARPEPPATAHESVPSAPAVSAAPVVAATAVSVSLVVPPAPPEPARSEEVSSTPCVVAGLPRLVAPSAIVQAGVEVRALGNDVAIGFAPNEHQATALRLDATSLSPSGTIDSPSADAVRRVVPLGSANGALSLAVDVDHEGDPVQGRRTIPFDPPLQIGAAGGNLVWARADGSVGGSLWPIDGEGPVDAARGARGLGNDATTTALVVRHGDAVWIGAATGRDELLPRGGLTRVRGLGSAVGSPAVAVNDGVVVAAWADRISSNDPWHLQWVHFKAGEAPGDPDTFVPPAGGKGAQAMSPSVSAVAGGRFLLVWTEGPATRHDVRALTLSREGQPLGKPMAISTKSANAGQGQAAVVASRQGVVAFLESTDNGFRVVATPIRCAR